MTIKYNNVYVDNSALVVGPYENDGPYSKYYDKHYDDLRFGEATWEQAEMKLMNDSINILLSKTNKKDTDIDIALGSDLLNQIVVTNYNMTRFNIPFLGIYNACASSGAALIIASNLIDSNNAKNALITMSSHNMSAEKQYRYPTEYGGPKPKISTFTVTVASSLLLTNKESKIKVESATVGRVVDSNIKDAFNMGGVMAISAANTIMEHLKDTKRKSDYYDLILTGDLGVYGKEILREYLKTKNIELNNLMDAGSIIFDRKKQKVFAGGSGIGCGPAIMYGYIFNEMKNNKLKKVLYVPTGALMNTTMVNQKLTIPSISHAVSFEVIK